MLKKIFSRVVISLSLLVILVPVFVEADVYVKGYYKKNGTYVEGHYRSSPDNSPYNNYSYPGNTNPYTGKVAPGNPDTYLDNYYSKLPSPKSSTAYPTSYNSTSYSKTVIPGGYKAYGQIFCDNGFYSRNNSECVAAPANSLALYSTFICNAGYYKNNNTECLPVPQNAYSLGDSFLCNAGYQKKENECVKNSIPNATWNGYNYTCNSGYYVDSSGAKCVGIDVVCKETYGINSMGTTDQKCGCIQGTQWNTSKTACETPKVTKYNFTRNLNLGTQGEDVKQLQYRLSLYNFLLLRDGVATGYFDEATKNALAAYQNSVGLPVTGYLGPQTRLVFNSAY